MSRTSPRKPSAPRQPRADKPRRAASRRVDEEPQGTLNLHVPERSGRFGDFRPAEQERKEFPPERVREAGLTAAEVPRSGPDVESTADDLTPETMLDENLSRAPSASDDRAPQDTILRVVDESGIGEGGGKDEGELALEQPISPEEHAQRQRDADQRLRDEEEYARARRQRSGQP